MPTCEKCGAYFEGARCPSCGETTRASRRGLNKRIQKYLYLSLVGLFGIIAADRFYPPLDENPVMFLALALFFVPILTQVVLTSQRRLAPNVERLRRAYLCSGAVLVSIAFVLGLNGLMDRAPARLVRTSIVRKYVSRGKSTSYHVVVSSWRPGQNEERFRVSPAKYQSMYIGEPVVIEVHPGLFALPWYGPISPQ